MLEDAFLDLTRLGEFVLDPFLGSGSTLNACENTGRVCRGIEIDPLYIDVIIRRFEARTGKPVALEQTCETFASLMAKRKVAEGVPFRPLLAHYAHSDGDDVRWSHKAIAYARVTRPGAVMFADDLRCMGLMDDALPTWTESRPTAFGSNHEL